MFSVFVQDEYGHVVKEFDAISISVMPEKDMHEQYPDIISACEMLCPYFKIVDDMGNHFFPLYMFSVEIG